jgi:hypothetical protein
MVRFNLALAAALCVTLTMAGGTFGRANEAQRSAVDVSALVLKAPQVGPGYRSAVIPGGSKVQGQVTLDLCGGGYRSEALRVQRVQRAYARPGSPLQLSNEVVRYRSSGASLAFRELKRRLTHCPRAAVKMPEPGAPRVAFRLKPLHFSGLLPQSIAVQIHATEASQGGRTINSIATYQVRRGILSGVYTYRGSLAAQKQLALHASRESAKNLTAG